MTSESYYEENKILCPHPGEKFNFKDFPLFAGVLDSICI